jgi:Iron-containing redox enzyme
MGGGYPLERASRTRRRRIDGLPRGYVIPMQLPRPRGPFGAQLHEALLDRDAPLPEGVPSDEADFQLSLWVLYELHYRGIEGVDADREWDPRLIELRGRLEHEFESRVRELTKPLVVDALGEPDMVSQLERITGYDEGPSLTSYLQRQATEEQYREFLIQRSIYHLKESDPHAFAIPRLHGPAKVALAELQYDEFGGGVPERLHSQLFADALDGAGLDSRYGAYADVATPQTLALNNVMSLFALHRRLRGACMGHLAAFEMTSSIPCRKFVQGAQRLELDERVVTYFDEHVEADAVHEQIAARDICARLAADEPELHDDVLVGAAACVLLEAAAGGDMVERWTAGESSLWSHDG